MRRVGPILLLLCCCSDDTEVTCPAVENDLCPGQSTVSVQTQNLVSGAPEEGVTASAATGETATSAPNGRLVLCVAAESSAVVTFSKPGFINTEAEFSGGSLCAGAPVHTLPIATQAELAPLSETLGITRTAETRTILVSLQTPSGPASSIQLERPDTFARGPEGFASSRTPGEDGILMFTTELAPVSVATQTDLSCSGATTVTANRGAITLMPLLCSQ